MRMERLSTGIDGLNRILGGGIPKGSWVVVLGRPGSGKSTMGRLFLMQGAARGEPAVLVTTKEYEEELRNSFTYLGYNTENMKNLRFIECLPTTIKKTRERTIDPSSLSDLSIEIGKAFSELGAEAGKNPRMLFDSMTDPLLFNSKENVLRFLQNLRANLANMEVTAMLVLEEGIHDDSTVVSLEYFCDGTIRTKLDERGRYFMVSRMRWTNCESVWLRFTLGRGRSIEI